MNVPVERAAEAWCTRTTNGIANGKLTLGDVNALNVGTASPAAREVLMTMSDGKLKLRLFQAMDSEIGTVQVRSFIPNG